MKREDAEEFTHSLGQIVGGSVRQIELADKLGVPNALGLSLDDWVKKHLGGYAKLAREDRIKLVEKWKAEEDISDRKAAARLGVDPKTVRRDTEANAPQDADAAVTEQGLSKECEAFASPSTAEKRKAGEVARKAILHAPADPKLDEGIYCADFEIGSQGIEDASVELVFTDPPYDKESVDLYRKAAKVAARILKPGGSFVAYSGQKYLPEVYGLINHPALRYWWTFAGVHAGGNQMLQKLGIRCGWKPLVWYVKGTRGDVSEVLVDVVTGAREKTHHEWQQAQIEAEHFIGKLASKGGLVVDFFLGGGTSAAAAAKLGRRFIGFEIDSAVFERAKQRLAEAA